jgi:hypothetical protein
MPFDRMELAKGVWRYSHIGFLLGILGVGGFFLGRWIDGLIWQYPFFSILLFMGGFALGFYRFILLIQEDSKKKKKKNEPM